MGFVQIIAPSNVFYSDSMSVLYVNQYELLWNFLGAVLDFKGVRTFIRGIVIPMLFLSDDVIINQRQINCRIPYLAVLHGRE